MRLRSDSWLVPGLEVFERFQSSIVLTWNMGLDGRCPSSKPLRLLGGGKGGQKRPFGPPQTEFAGLRPRTTFR